MKRWWLAGAVGALILGSALGGGGGRQEGSRWRDIVHFQVLEHDKAIVNKFDNESILVEY